MESCILYFAFTICTGHSLSLNLNFQIAVFSRSNIFQIYLNTDSYYYATSKNCKWSPGFWGQAWKYDTSLLSLFSMRLFSRLYNMGTGHGDMTDDDDVNNANQFMATTPKIGVGCENDVSLYNSLHILQTK